jgi:hypothetical protein
MLIDWEEFSIRFGVELRRLGVSDREARFLGFDSPDERVFELLALLTDNIGVEALYNHLGADYNELVRRESESRPLDA